MNVGISHGTAEFAVKSIPQVAPTGCKSRMVNC